MTGEHCAYCGRELVDVEEPSVLFDRATGLRVVEVWRQCPRYPKNGWQALYRGCHESFKRECRAVGRRWS